MASSSSAEQALLGSATLLRGAGMLLIGGMVLGLLAPELFLLALSISLLLGCFAVAWRLFRAIQIRIAELLLVVALLGSVFGIGLRAIQINIRRPDEIVVLSGLLLLGSFLVIAGGITNGLIVAKRLRMERTGERIWLALLFLLHPAGIAGTFICPFVWLLGLSNEPTILLLSLVLWPFSLLIWHESTTLRRRARARAGELI